MPESKQREYKRHAGDRLEGDKDMEGQREGQIRKEWERCSDGLFFLIPGLSLFTSSP